ncbi:unnamed protein product [Cylindrotheca closterium]|uniref:Uncharacterized protein n=1 Tax=Cylindrotheca closterium TaxID=2856 RepID=A0AAD2G2B4_9STRA|nr:unnamed protein product [Cylindrotheca closterium]CAJ1960167.1 unnamed protein product [Cylindrotheca closterium]
MSQYYNFDENVFRDDVEDALQTVEKILDADRRPRPAEEVHHKYENKYELANYMTNISIVAQMNVLERLGFTPQIIQQLEDTKTKTTTLRFEASEICTFLKEQTVDVPDPYAVETVKERTSVLGSTPFKSKSSTIHKVIRKVNEYHWTVKAHWEITIFSGTEVDKKIMLQSRDSSTIVVTQSKDAPMEKVEKHTPVDLNLTWMLKQIDMENKATGFSIDVTKANTPRRNEQVEASMNFFCSRMNSWLYNVKSHFSRNLQRIISSIHNPAIPPPSHQEKLARQCSASGLFQPILPILEENKVKDGESVNDELLILEGGDNADAPQSVSTLALPSGISHAKKQECQLLLGKDTIQLLNAQVKSIDTKLKSLNEVFPASHQMKLFSIAEATVFLMLDHSEKLCLQYQHAIGYLEKMLENQLVAAIGKRVTNDDLEEFVRFHNAKFLTIPPKPFCHAIGRPNRFPYGVLSIESKGDSDNTIPIETMMRPVQMEAPLEVPLNAATTLQLTGNTYLHGWMHQRSESGGTNKSFQLSARARQFSSFMLVIGTMAGPNKLNPKDAIILQNKDEVLIPLLLEEIPSAKEFKDAIESLSPEQQRFAKSFRGMQLESSVFGVAVIQIKPQLEALLGLPEDSLAKEIKLTEDLMELFVEYQVPSDLLSYDELAVAVSTSEKVDIVRQNVKAVMSVVEGTKEKQLEAKTMKAEMAVASAAQELCFEQDTIPSIGASYGDYSPPPCGSMRRSAGGGGGGGRGGGRRGFAEVLGLGANFSRAPSREEGCGSPPPQVLLGRSKGNVIPKNRQLDRGAPPPPNSTDAVWIKQEPDYDWSSEKPKDALWKKEEPNYDWSGAQPFERPADGLVTLSTTSRDDDEPGEYKKQNVENNIVPNSTSKTKRSPSQAVDFTSIPKTLDATIEKFDKDSTLRSTKLKTMDTWSRKRQPDLLTKPTTNTLAAKDVKSESNKAYDLLDAISRSGSLPIAYSDLHVVVCVTHCFAKDVMATVVEDNVNPIEKLEMSTLLLGSAIHGTKPIELIAEEANRARFQSSFPLMLETEGGAV